MRRLGIVLAALTLALGVLIGWTAERCARLGWTTCASVPVAEINWSPVSSRRYAFSK